MQHFMPPGLLHSQFEALEPLAPDEAGAVVSVEGGPQQIAERALAALPHPLR
jgi:gluconokinase